MVRHGVASEKLREEMAIRADILSNGLPPYTSYRALNAAHMLPADKKPGVRQLACGESWMRLLAQVNLEQPRGTATAACGNSQLCARLKSGIEGNLHAVYAIWPASNVWDEPENTTPNASELDSEEEDTMETQKGATTPTTRDTGHR